MKTVAQKVFRRLMEDDIDAVGTPQELSVAALGVGPVGWINEIKAGVQAAYDSYQTRVSAVNGASSKAALKTAVKPILDAHPDGANYKRMFGKDDVID